VVVVVTAGARLKLALLQRINNLLAVADRGVARGGPGTPSPIPLKILGIKRVRTTHALHIRLIEL